MHKSKRFAFELWQLLYVGIQCTKKEIQSTIWTQIHLHCGGMSWKRSWSLSSASIVAAQRILFTRIMPIINKIDYFKHNEHANVSGKEGKQRCEAYCGEECCWNTRPEHPVLVRGRNFSRGTSFDFIENLNSEVINQYSLGIFHPIPPDIELFSFTGTSKNSIFLQHR